MSEPDTYTLEVPIIETPHTVISLVPSVTESLFDLNLGSKLIGRTDFCVYPADQVATIPTVGGTKNPNVDQIIALAPDLVIANIEENRQQDIAAIQAANIPVWLTFPKTVQDALNLLWEIMNLFDETAMVPRVRLIEYVYDRLENLSQSNEEQLPAVFVPIWADPYMTANADTYLHDVLRVCGGRNIFADRKRIHPLSADLGQSEPREADDRLQNRDTRYPRITLDEVVALQPDIVLLPSEPFQFTTAHVEIFMGLNIPAAHHKRIHLIDGALLTWHGTRLAYALDQIPNLLRMDQP